MYDSNKIRNTHTIETLDESNQTLINVAINVVTENIFKHIQYGSWSKIIRVMGCMMRTSFNLKARNLRGKTRHEALIVVELLRAKKMLGKKIQQREFGEKYAQLEKKVVSKKSKLR